MNISTLNKSKVLLYQIPGSGDQQGGQSFPEQALWRGQMVNNLNVYFYV